MVVARIELKPTLKVLVPEATGSTIEIIGFFEVEHFSTQHAHVIVIID